MLKQNTMQKIILSFLVLVVTTGTGYAQTALRTKQFNLEKGVAIQGYDPVAYFAQGKAIKGNKQFAASAEGVLYYFSSAANKDLFLKDYKKYEPQYGGWCAYAMGATNEKVEIDPETLKIYYAFSGAKATPAPAPVSAGPWPARRPRRYRGT